jgi:ADP-ribose pyrophosphatase YjhB (NUDIX family)
MSEFKRYSGVLVKYKNEVLLCKRAKKESLPFQWSVPSGGIEKDENPVDAALREFKEETNIKLEKKLDLIGIISKYKNDKKTKKGLVYIFQYNSDKKLIPDLEKAKDGFEHSECGYFNQKNLPLTEKNKDLLEIIKKTF